MAVCRRPDMTDRSCPDLLNLKAARSVAAVAGAQACWLEEAAGQEYQLVAEARASPSALLSSPRSNSRARGSTGRPLCWRCLVLRVRPAGVRCARKHQHQDDSHRSQHGSPSAEGYILRQTGGIEVAPWPLCSQPAAALGRMAYDLRVRVLGER